MEQYCNVVPVLGCNSAKFDLNLIKSYSLTIFDNEQDIDPTVIKKVSQFISLKFVDIQLLHILKFRGEATSLVVLLRAYTTSKTETFFPCEKFYHPNKKQKTEFLL